MRAWTDGGGGGNTFAYIFHEINDSVVISRTCKRRACNLRCVRAQRVGTAEDIFSKLTSLVLTFCRNTVEVKNVKKGERSPGK